MSQAHPVLKSVSRIMTLIGNAFVVIGVLGLAAGMLGFYRMDIFAFGLSSGVRIIGTVAIAGCLLSAIGYGIAEYIEKNHYQM